MKKSVFSLMLIYFISAFCGISHAYHANTVEFGDIAPSTPMYLAQTIDGNFVWLIKDKSGNMTAVTIGNRGGQVGENSLTVGSNNVASEQNSMAVGSGNTASKENSAAIGYNNTASASNAIALGTASKAKDNYSIVWSGTVGEYLSHGVGTFNINPNGGLNGMYINNTTMHEYLYTSEEELQTYLNTQIVNPHTVKIATNRTQFYDINFSKHYTNEIFYIKLPKSNLQRAGKLTLYVRESTIEDFKYDFALDNIDLSTYPPEPRRWLTDEDETIWKFEFESYPSTTDWTLVKYTKQINIPLEFSTFYFNDREPELVNVVRLMDDRYEGDTTLTNVVFGKNVTQILPQAFRNCSNLTSIIIPTTVSDIGWYAFSGSGLTSVTIPSSVTAIRELAFRDCINLTNVTILGNVANDWIYESRPFANCTNLQTVVLGDNMTKIGNYMFAYCSNLTSVIIPESVKSIGSRAFYNDNSLVNVTISDGVLNIENNAFYGCKSLNSISIPVSVTNIGNSAFAICRSLTDLTIPDGVTSIGESAFMFCDSLTSVTIPDSVVNIGDKAFYRCTSIQEVYCKKVATDDPVATIKDKLRGKGIDVDDPNITFEAIE